MELKRFAGFFEDEVATCHRAFLDRCRYPDAKAWLDACSKNLLRDLFTVTHKVLIAQYKLIEADVDADAYCVSLRDPQVREYLHSRFPGLRLAIANVCQGWLVHACSVVERFHRDLELIRVQLLHGNAPLEIEQVSFGMGDSHRGGRSVTILSFRDGRRLVYKPRSLAIDSHFARILAWTNSRCGTDLRTPAHLDSKEHGWVEFIDYTACRSAAEVDCFYLRMGHLLALLYILEGCDFHHENIIAAGGHPILIDLESFFHPHLGGEVRETLDTTVLKVGMLPNRLTSLGDVPDISGLSDAEGQLGFEGLHVVRAQDGTLSFVRGRGTLKGSQNVPMLDGARIELQAQHALRLKRGFEHVYRAVLDDLSGFSALVEGCADAQVRVLFRHTATYGHLIEESRHPSLMASTQATAAHYELLRMGVSDYPAANQFVDFEISDLHRGDVPLFTTLAGSRHLWFSDTEFLPEFFEKSGLEAVRRKLAMLSPQDLDRQLWIIGNAFVCHSSEAKARGHVRLDATGSDGQALDDRLLAQAKTLATQLRGQMHEAEDAASWLVYRSSSLDSTQFDLVPAFHDLYGGMPGEILFYSQLAQVTGDPSHGKLARKVLHYLKQRLRESSSGIHAVGLYVGWGSIVHLMAALGQLESNYEHLDYLEELLADSRFDELIANDRNFSLIKGAAGFMLACSNLHIINGSARALQLARASAAHLLVHRCREVDGYAWRLTSAEPLSGLAHGASGFAMAFARLYQATREAEYREISLASLEYERSLFQPACGNWLDRRDFVIREREGAPWCSTAWAHGAPGIGLARLALLEAGIDTPEVRADLEIALRTTIEQGFTGSDSLIFGSFGNLELLASYVECFGAESIPSLPNLIEPLLQRIEQHGLRLNAPAAYPLGLMAGATGIAYQCLRLARLRQVPSVLCGTSSLPVAESAVGSRLTSRVPEPMLATE